MLTGALLAAACFAGGTALWRLGRREHRAALSQRAALLDEAAALFPGSRTAPGPDGFPALRAPVPEGQVEISVLADTLVTRRLPQLWLVLTLRETEPARDFSLGALARPTGAEFYALTHDLPDWVAPPPGDVPLLMRGRDLSSDGSGHAGALAAFFADPMLKEAAATPRGVRVVRQACRGERGAHLLLRQARFGTTVIPAALVVQALDEARRIGALLSRASNDAPAGLREAA